MAIVRDVKVPLNQLAQIQRTNNREQHVLYCYG